MRPYREMVAKCPGSTVENSKSSKRQGKASQKASYLSRVLQDEKKGKRGFICRKLEFMAGCLFLKVYLAWSAKKYEGFNFTIEGPFSEHLTGARPSVKALGMC